MTKKSVVISIPEGLCARSTALFIEKANKFQSNLEIESDGRRVNGKSIIGVMSLGAFQGEKIILRADGEDEQEMIESLAEFLELKVH